MCGIVGILGREQAAPRLIEALKRLEYRGYDSAGLAVLENGHIGRLRAEGKLANLEARLDDEPLGGFNGIGHTRWATHGAPSEANAHPHLTDRVAIVHNGIIENFHELRGELTGAGVNLASDTDTEIVAHMISRELDNGLSPDEATTRTLGRLEGAFAFAIVFAGKNDLMIAARRGAPLALGYGEGEMFLGSDAIALAPWTNRICYLEDGDHAVISHDGARIFDNDGMPADRPLTYSATTAAMIEKGNHRHFMAKEIAEQPEVIAHTLGEYADFTDGRIRLPETVGDFADIERLTVTACGTAFYAGLVAKYWFERYARLATDTDVASEFRYREAPLPDDGMALFISQSGETADTLAALRYCKQQNQRTLGVVNVPESSIARECDAVIPTFAGPEIGVASTKAFTCQLTALACMAIAAGRQRGHIDEAAERELVRALMETPRHIAACLRLEDEIAGIAQRLTQARDILYLGRGINFPIAMEGALKLKEISYIHAEGYAAGELKHGPIALIDDNVPVIVIAPGDDLFDKTVSNMREVAARGGRIVLITDMPPADIPDGDQFDIIAVPRAPAFINPILFTVPVQLLAYHAAVFMGTDIDQPRNLAKSVTVE
jgi:glucosamine--fructose-6-phosphate aminotransferase (isomerizing)